MGPTTRSLPFRDCVPVIEKGDDGSLFIWQDLAAPSAEKSIAHLFAARAQKYPDRILVAQRKKEEAGFGDWQTISYGAMLKRACAIAATLREKNLGNGARIMVLSEESIEHAALMFGAMLARSVLVPVSVGYSTSPDHERLARVAAIAAPAAVFAEHQQQFAAALETAARDNAVRLVGGIGDNSLHDLQERGHKFELAEALDRISHETVYRLLFTSGSTGAPKASIQTHGMSCASLAFERALSTREPSVSAMPEVVLDWLPWSHVGGGITILNNVLSSGASLFIDGGRPVYGRFEETLRNLRENPPEIYASPPAVTAMLADAMDADPDFRDRFFSRLIYIRSGAAPLDQALFDRFQAHSRAAIGMDTAFVAGYGTTETHGVVSRTWASRDSLLLGWPKPGVRLRLAPLEAGYEIRIKSASVTQGYLNDPEATTAAFDDDGYFRTGDTAILDESGAHGGVRYTSRLGETFKLANGTWVSAAYVRAGVLAEVGALVDDCLVVGEGQQSLGLLVWTSDASVERLAALTECLRRYNSGTRGGSTRIDRFVVSTQPISATDFERTEKGTLNRALILKRRDKEMRLLFGATQKKELVLIPD